MWQQMGAGSGENMDRVFCRESGGEGVLCPTLLLLPPPELFLSSTERQNTVHFPRLKYSAEKHLNNTLYNSTANH